MFQEPTVPTTLRVVFDASALAAVHRAVSSEPSRVVVCGHLGGFFAAQSSTLRVATCSASTPWLTPAYDVTALGQPDVSSLDRACPGATVVGWFRSVRARAQPQQQQPCPSQADARVHATMFTGTRHAVCCTLYCSPADPQRFSFGVWRIEQPQQDGTPAHFVPVPFAVNYADSPQQQLPPPPPPPPPQQQQQQQQRQGLTMSAEMMAVHKSSPSPMHAMSALRAFDSMHSWLVAPEAMDTSTTTDAPSATTTAGAAAAPPASAAAPAPSTDAAAARDLAVMKLAARRAAKNQILDLWRRQGRPEGGLEELCQTAKLEPTEDFTLRQWYDTTLSTLTTICKTPNPAQQQEQQQQPSQQRQAAIGKTPSPPPIITDESDEDASSLAICDSPPRPPSIATF